MEEKDRLKNIEAGITLLHQEMKGLRGDVQQALMQGEQGRRRADEDRRRSDERFERLIQEAHQDRRRSDVRFNRMQRAVITVGRRILQTQKEHTELLKDIRRRLPPTHGKGRNGGNGPSPRHR